MKSFIKNNIKFILVIAICLIGSSITTLATNYIFSSNEVSYDNTESGLHADEVQGAIDEVFQHATDYSDIKTTIGTGSLTTTSNTLIGGVNELNNKITHIDDHKRAYFYYAAATTTMTLTFPLEQGWGVIKGVGNASARHLLALYRQDSSGIGFIIPISKGSNISYRTPSDSTNPTAPGVLILTKDSGGFAIEYENLRPQSASSVVPTFS